MKYWWVIALGIIFGILSAGILCIASLPPNGNAIALLPPPTPIPIQVHISGEVQNPGVYALQPGSRVQNAIEIAGGFSAKADNTNLDLAAPLEVGTRYQVRAQPPIETPAPPNAATSKDEKDLTKLAQSPTQAKNATTCFNINTASKVGLETLLGIGPATYEKNKDFIIVGDAP